MKFELESHFKFVIFFLFKYMYLLAPTMEKLRNNCSSIAATTSDSRCVQGLGEISLEPLFSAVSESKGAIQELGWAPYLQIQRLEEEVPLAKGRTI